MLSLIDCSLLMGASNETTCETPLHCVVLKNTVFLCAIRLHVYLGASLVGTY